MAIITFLVSAIKFGMVLLFGSTGETITEKSGNLNLGVPGIMYLGAYAGYLSAYLYENHAANPNAFVCILLALLVLPLVRVLRKQRMK